jgi:hypothetical protein
MCSLGGAAREPLAAAELEFDFDELHELMSKTAVAASAVTLNTFVCRIGTP